MPRTALSAQDLGQYAAGAALTLNAVDQPNGNTFPNDGKTFLMVTNGSGGSLTVTVTGATTPDRSYGQTVTKTYAPANGARWLIGPFSPAVFNQSTGLVNVDWSTGSSVTCAVVTYTPTPNQ